MRTERSAFEYDDILFATKYNLYTSITNWEVWLIKNQSRDVQRKRLLYLGNNCEVWLVENQSRAVQQIRLYYGAAGNMSFVSNNNNTSSFIAHSKKKKTITVRFEQPMMCRIEGELIKLS